MSGRKIFEFPFTVSKAGTYNLPAVEFSYFDVHDAKYKTAASKPIEIKITKGTGKSSQINVDSNIKSKDNYLTRFFSNRLRVASLFAVLIIMGLIVWLKRDSKKEQQLQGAGQVAEKMKDEDKPVEEILLTQENPLAIAEECLQREDADLFYRQLNLGLKNYLSKKFGIAGEQINKKNIAEQLDKKGISNETAVQLQELIDEIEWQLYTPLVDSEKMKGMYERANDMIQLINTYRS